MTLNQQPQTNVNRFNSDTREYFLARQGTHQLQRYITVRQDDSTDQLTSDINAVQTELIKSCISLATRRPQWEANNSKTSSEANSAFTNLGFSINRFYNNTTNLLEQYSALLFEDPIHAKISRVAEVFADNLNTQGLYTDLLASGQSTGETDRDAIIQLIVENNVTDTGTLTKLYMEQDIIDWVNNLQALLDSTLGQFGNLRQVFETEADLYIAELNAAPQNN